MRSFYWGRVGLEPTETEVEGFTVGQNPTAINLKISDWCEDICCVQLERFEVF